MKVSRGLLSFGAVLAIVACQTIDVHHEYNTRAPFGTYKTFAWVTDQPLLPASLGEMAGDPRLSPVMEGDLRAAIERNLAEKGYHQRSAPEDADLVLSFSLGTRDKIEIDSYPTRAGYGWGPYRGWGGWESDVRTYTEGMLAIDFFDRHTKQAVWHGWATKRIASRPRSQEDRVKTINEVVDAILAEFPFRNIQQ